MSPLQMFKLISEATHPLVGSPQVTGQRNIMLGQIRSSVKARPDRSGH